MDRGEFSDWIRAYERAWRTAGTDALWDLFTDDASYLTAPFRDPHVGVEAIRAMWDEEREGPDEGFTMAFVVLAVEGDTGVARVDVKYAGTGHRYLDLWVARFAADGRCREFEEWFWLEPVVGG